MGAANSVAIIDSGGANINSIVFAFERLGCVPVFTRNWQVIRDASRVVLPGVGSAGAAMNRLHESGLAEKIPTLQQPVLGICLGMQLLFESSEEANVECLGVIPESIKALKQPKDLTVPHMGWNSNRVLTSDNGLLQKVEDGFYSYFVHSFAAPVCQWTLASCNHGQWFSSMVQKENFSGIQFHPERSGPIGLRLLANFLAVGLPEQAARELK